jgi:hypothetical protein
MNDSSLDLSARADLDWLAELFGDAKQAAPSVEVGGSSPIDERSTNSFITADDHSMSCHLVISKIANNGQKFYITQQQ